MWRCDETVGCDKETQKVVVHYSIVETGAYENGVHDDKERKTIIESLEQLNKDLGCVM